MKLNGVKLMTLILAFIILIFICSLGFLGFFLGNQCLDTEEESLTSFFIAALESQSYAKRAEGHLTLYLALGRDEDKEKFSSRIDSLEENIDVLDKGVKSPYEKDLLTDLKNAKIGLARTGEKLIELYDSNPSGFKVEEHEELIRSLRNSAHIVRESGVAIAQNHLMDSAIAISSDAKQSESYLLLLYLNFHKEKDKVRFFELIETLENEISSMEENLVNNHIEQAVLLDEIKEAKEILVESANELIEIHDADPEGFDFSPHEELILKYHDASSLIRKNGVEIAKKNFRNMMKALVSIKREFRL
jgi:cell division protein FtsB